MHDIHIWDMWNELGVSYQMISIFYFQNFQMCVFLLYTFYHFELFKNV